MKFTVGNVFAAGMLHVGAFTPAACSPGSETGSASGATKDTAGSAPATVTTLLACTPGAGGG